MTGQKPVMKISAGSSGISAALWENATDVKGRTVQMMKCTVDKRYKAKDGTYKSTGSFSRSDLPFVIWALERAFTEMIERKDTDGDEVVVEEVLAA